ncbi:MAG: PP2C family serine/threonine-protein phosphatase, partial [Verrucomicrobiota bacterium]
ESPVILTPVPPEAAPQSATPRPACIVSPPPVPAQVKPPIRDRLPNASVGKPYSQNLGPIFGEIFKRVVGLKFEPTQGSGLVLDAPNATLHGTPTIPGEMQIVIRYRFSDTAGSHPGFSHTLALTVNPDPSSLWKNLPSDKNGAFAKPDTATAFRVTPHLTVMAASLRGRSHAHEGKYREDDFGLDFIEATGWHILISADGAGSAKFSRRGSQLACETALAVIKEKLSNEENQLNAALSKLGASNDTDDLEKLRQLSYNVLMLAAHQAHTAIQKQAKESQATPRDFASTFIVVIARRVESRWFFASFSIGDGGAGALLADGTLISLTSPDSGDFAGQTLFITMPQIFSDPAALLARTHAAFCPDFKFLAAMSDGITDPIFQSDANLASSTEWEKWGQQLAKIVNLDAPTSGMEATLLDYLNFASPGNHDDRTLLIAVPTPAKT